MKINILMPLLFQDIEENDYINLSPFPTFSTSDKITYCHYQNLGVVVDDGEAEHISCKEVLNFISHLELEKTLSHWCKKIRHGGRISLCFEDINEICRLISLGSVSEEDGVKILYGGQEDGWNFKKSGITTSFIKKTLVKNDMIIENIKLDSFYCYIEARRE